MSMFVNPDPDNEGWTEEPDPKYAVDPQNPSIILEFEPDDKEASDDAPEGQVVGGHLTATINNMAKPEAIVALQVLLDDLNRQVSEEDVERAQEAMTRGPE
jgi:hypothetical protein